jgi:hypothetical protein
MAAIGLLDGPQQACRLPGQMLFPSQQLPDRRVGRGCKRTALFLIEYCPLGLMTRLEQRVAKMSAHGLILPLIAEMHRLVCST